MVSSERHVKLFKNGRSQAVRIPREFELPGEDAMSIQSAFEQAGIRFLDNEPGGGIGVRLSAPKTSITPTIALLLREPFR